MTQLNFFVQLSFKTHPQNMVCIDVLILMFHLGGSTNRIVT